MNKMPQFVECCASTLKIIGRCLVYVFRILNAYYFFEGFYLTLMASMYLGGTHVYKYMDTTHPTAFNCLTVILGCLLLIMSMISFPLSFISASPKCFQVYAASILFLSCLQVVTIVVSISFNSEIIASSERLQVRLQESYSNNSTDIEFRSTVEHKLQCCGLDGPRFYDVPPETCCKIIRDKNAPGKYKPVIPHTYSECLSLGLINYDDCRGELASHLDELITPKRILICIVGSVFKIYSALMALMQAKWKKHLEMSKRSNEGEPPLMMK